MNATQDPNSSEENPPGGEVSVDDLSTDNTPADVYHEPAHFGVFIALAAGMLGLFLIVLILILVIGKE